LQLLTKAEDPNEFIEFARVPGSIGQAANAVSPVLIQVMTTGPNGSFQNRTELPKILGKINK
jgi:hypothetical protein